MLRIIGCAVAILLLAGCARDNEVVIVFGGDVMLDRGIRAEIKANGLDFLLDDIRPVFHRADYAVINLECPVTDIKSPLTKEFIFRADPDVLPVLREAGVTHCILANNHSYDQGRAGLVSTAANLTKADIVALGYGETQREACSPVEIHKNGIDVAVFSSVTLLLESWMYLEGRPGMCQATAGQLTNAIASYRAEHPHAFIILTLHWGVEYRKYPTAQQVEQATAFVKAGADAIVGHHPHVIQEHQYIDGKPVFYSIGNLVFDNPNPETHEGILLEMRISADTSTVNAIPYRADNGKPMLQ